MRQYQPSPSTWHPLIPLIDDSDAPNAANFDIAPEALADNAEYLYTRQGAMPGLTWGVGLTQWGTYVDELTGTGGPYPLSTLSCAPVWDAYAGRWLAGGTPGGGATSWDWLLESFDGLAWHTAFGQGVNGGLYLAIIGSPVGIAASTVDGTLGIVGSVSGNHPFVLLANAADTVCTGVTLSAPVAGHSYGVTWFAGQFVLWRAGTITNPWYVASAVVTAATTWSASAEFRSSELSWVQTPTTLALFPAISVNAPTSYMTTTDGQNWTQQALPALLAGEVVLAAWYAEDTGVWYMATGPYSAGATPATGSTRLWSSPTGIAGTWSLYTTTVPHPAYGGASIGGVQYLWLATHAQPWPSSKAYGRLAYSTDMVTWRWAALMDPTLPNVVASGFSLESNGTQLLYVNGWTDATAGCNYAASAGIGADMPIVT